MNVAGRVIIVTGAASGIGRAVAQGFCRDGAYVTGFDVDERVLAESKATGGDRMYVTAGDVCSVPDIEVLVKDTLTRFGRIDVLFNNAGISDRGPFLSIPFEQWLQVIQVNLIGAALCLRHVLPVMLEQKHGRVINVVMPIPLTPKSYDNIITPILLYNS